MWDCVIIVFLIVNYQIPPNHFDVAALVSCTHETLQLPSSPAVVRASGVTFFKFFFQTIPDKRVGTPSKFSPSPTFKVDNQMIFSLFVGKNAIFSNIEYGGWGIRDTAQVSQLLLAGIVVINDEEAGREC